MMRREAHRLRSRIERLLVHTGRLEDQEDREPLVKFACVMVCGYLELTSRETLLAYVALRSDPSVKRYVASRIRRFNTPTSARLLELVDAFDHDHRNELHAFMGDQIRDQVDSIVSNRNLIAHGYDVGLTLNRVHQYFLSADRVAKKIRELFPETKSPLFR